MSISIFSCASKKYGRHFQNKTSSSHTILLNEYVGEKPVLVASTQQDFSSQIPELATFHEVKIHMEERPIKEIKRLKQNRKWVSISKKGDRSVPNQKSNRKLEPVGLGAFGLFLIPTLMGISTGFTPLLFALIGISMVAGVISVFKIDANKKKWKGRFFGNFVVITGILLLVLLGLDALIQSMFGST